MPTENERKYVLSINSQEKLSSLAAKKYYIFQGYLAMAKGMSVRLRRSISQNKEKRILTLKQKVDNRIIEIEKKINQRDFDDLWKIALNKLEKIRYNLYFEEYKWEIDFFLIHHNKHEEVYFAQAEHEMPEGQEKPNFIPEPIKQFLLYEVPLTDDRFSSKRLADIKHAKELYQSLIQGVTCHV